MIFAAGLGTRLAPLTDNTPKALVKLKGKPLLQHVIENLVDQGTDDITVNVHHFAAQIYDYVNTPEFQNYVHSKKLKIQISDESTKLLDTGGGLRHAFPLLFDGSDLPVLIHNVDIISNANLANIYNKISNEDVVLLVSNRTTSRYLLFDTKMRLVGWTNISTGEVRSPYDDIKVENCIKLAFSGIHVVSKHAVESMQAWPDRFSIMDFYIQMCNHLNIKGVVQENLKLMDVGKIDVLRKLEETILR